MIAKRVAPINRAKDYARKIRQARLKLSENASGSTGSSSMRLKSTIEKSPKKESDGKNDDEQEDDYLAIANDVNFDEDENESVGGKKNDPDQSMMKKESSTAGDDGDKAASAADQKDSNESTSHDDKRHQRGTSECKESDRKVSGSVKYVCVHCDKDSDSSKVSAFLCLHKLVGFIREFCHLYS
jgi:hypothetical protein